MTRKYRVTVNGKAYEVDVEDMGAGAAAPLPAAPAAAAPAPAVAVSAPAAPAPIPAPAAAAPAPAAAGSASIDAPMPGKILKILVSAGTAVTKGQVVLILEAMKMENEIFASKDGTISQVCTKEGDSVNTGDTLLVIG